MSYNQNRKDDSGRAEVKRKDLDPQNLKKLAESLVAYGRADGADEVEVTLVDGYEFNVDVRLQQIENLVEAGSRYLSLRVIKDKKIAYAGSSDLSQGTLKYLLKNAIKRAVLANSDKFAGLPPPSPKKIDVSSLSLYDPEIPSLTSKKKIDLALETEKIALLDKRITNSHGASFVTNEVKIILANSYGFLEEFDQTFCSLSVGLQAGETDNLVEDFWGSAERHLKDLESPEEIAKKAVERTVRQLNPKKIRTQKVSVIFEPTMTSWLLGFLFACVSGVSIYHRASFLVDKLGERIGNEKITIYDDGLMPARLGTKPFDSEGVPSQKTVVVEHGILKNYLCNTYAARKLNLRSTGNADGAGVSPNNFYLEAGTGSPQEIIRSTEKGLLLVRTLGHGLNPITGDISRGAFGLWIEKGEIVHPVSEVTISGNLGEILRSADLVGNDLEFRGSICGPTIKVAELMVAGE
jgi:PmbA protein